MRAALVLLLLPTACTGFTACVARDNAAAQNAVDVNVAPVGSMPRIEITSSGEQSLGGLCRLTLAASPIEKSSAGCYLDAHIEKGAGALVYPCSGTGPAVADFGTEQYAGKMDDGRLSIERTTELDWEDNCRWGTHAVIEGTLPKGKPLATQNLAWTYSDRVISGDGCSGVCRAHANLAASTIPAGEKGDRDGASAP